MNRIAKLAVITLVVSVPVAALADKVTEVVIVDNTKTTDDTVRYIAGVDEGDEWNSEILEKVKIDLVSSGLFKKVEIFSEPHPKGGLKITIIAKDKHSWIIAPTYYNQPTNRGAGVGFGENNLFGQNKKLLLYAQVATGDSFFVAAYIDPQIGNTPFKWQFDVFTRRERVFEYESPFAWRQTVEKVRQSKINYLNAGTQLGVTLFRSFTIEGRLRGAHVSYDDPILLDTVLDVDQVTDDPAACLTDLVARTTCKPGAEGWDVSAKAIIKFDRRSNWYGIKSGNYYSFQYEKALPSLGSDFDYWIAKVGYERARRYKQVNLIFKASVEMGEDVPFQTEITSGGTDLRGYEGRQFRGDFNARATTEFSVPLFTIKGLGLRALTFWDTSYITFNRADPTLTLENGDLARNYLPGYDKKGLKHWRNSVGAGVRVYIRQIVLPLLGLDFGYSPESGTTEIYLAIGISG